MQLAAACEPAQAEDERGACVDHVRRCARLGGECHLHARLQREGGRRCSRCGGSVRIHPHLEHLPSVLPSFSPEP